jgi:RNA polymerase sigma factor (TIGR02999 family)
MPRSASQSVSELLAKWRDGDQEALHAVVPLVYNQLRRVAHRYLRGERSNHTLQSTALVHEAYLRLAHESTRQFANRAHFFAVAARLMRQILVDFARNHRAAKRGGGAYRLTVNEAMASPGDRDMDLLALDRALEQLAQLDPQQSRIVELRFFCGLSIEETSDIIGVSPATVKRDWATARTWLHRQMSRAAK